MNGTQRASCFLCAHFYGNSGWRWPGDALGQCRRHAPVALTLDDQRVEGRWPRVSADDWCGDYEFAGVAVMNAEAPGRWP